jgi:hypothetical protein
MRRARPSRLKTDEPFGGTGTGCCEYFPAHVTFPSGSERDTVDLCHHSGNESQQPV